MNKKTRRDCDHNAGHKVNFETVDGVEKLRGCTWLTDGEPNGELHQSGCTEIKAKGVCPFVEQGLFIEPQKTLR